MKRAYACTLTSLADEKERELQAKRKRRAIRNRESAQRSRQRKRIELANLKEKVKQLTSENMLLRLQLERRDKKCSCGIRSGPQQKQQRRKQLSAGEVVPLPLRRVEAKCGSGCGGGVSNFGTQQQSPSCGRGYSEGPLYPSRFKLRLRGEGYISSLVPGP